MNIDEMKLQGGDVVIVSFPKETSMIVMTDVANRLEGFGIHVIIVPQNTSLTKVVTE